MTPSLPPTAWAELLALFLSISPPTRAPVLKISPCGQGWMLREFVPRSIVSGSTDLRDVARVGGEAMTSLVRQPPPCWALPAILTAAALATVWNVRDGSGGMPS